MATDIIWAHSESQIKYLITYMYMYLGQILSMTRNKQPYLLYNKIYSSFAYAGL